MKFLATAFAAAAFLISAVSAAGTENPFIVPAAAEVVEAGTTYKVEWKVTKGEFVKLTLLKGLSTNLDKVKVLDAKVPNTGTYSWKIDANLPKRTDYALEIRYGEGEFENNYTGQFTINSDIAEVSTTKATTSTKTSTTFSTTTTGTSNSTVTSATLKPTVSATDGPGANTTDGPVPGNSAGRSFGVSATAVLAIALGAVAFLG